MIESFIYLNHINCEYFNHGNGDGTVTLVARSREGERNRSYVTVMLTFVGLLAVDVFPALSMALADIVWRPVVVILTIIDQADQSPGALGVAIVNVPESTLT